jgi:hypothetical protein
MEVSGQLHAPAALPPGKEPLAFIGEEAGWAPEPFWIHGENQTETDSRSVAKSSSDPERTDVRPAIITASLCVCVF